ncbi:MAG: hypothetical protein ACFFCZ_23320, partial [Promethearchaeota archaeon]
MGSQRFSYLLLAILLLNLTTLIINADHLLSETKESESSNTLLDDGGEAAQGHKSMGISYVSDVLR